AEEVERVNPDPVNRDAAGKPQTVRNEQINAMLLNEFLKEHRKMEQQQAAIQQLESTMAQHEDLRLTVAQQRKDIHSLTASLKEQAAQIQKVSVEVSKANSPTVLNHQYAGR